MPDRTIPFCNTIMKCSDYNYRKTALPAGFSIVPYHFDSEAEAEKYFAETYLQNPELLPNILFARNKDGDVVGSCIAWQDMSAERNWYRMNSRMPDGLNRTKLCSLSGIPI